MLRQDQEQDAILGAKPQKRYPKCWAPQFGLGQIARDCLVAKSLWTESIFLDEHRKTLSAPLVQPDDGSPRIACLLKINIDLSFTHPFHLSDIGPSPTLRRSQG